ncbi:hypothetical protein CQW23_32471 [Capsicum baccatum]|uniref:Peptidase C1A papain C-terminal domain-containing protein n=1 Tax=Capsicum baccatum TaxID=33114 RepID=A0A2G2V4K6_CAPBA|nr:hypothetical protein CQW23_32471 [Capsicum baccatum]
MVKTTKEIEGVAMCESSKLGEKPFFQKISFSWVGKKCLLCPQSQKKTKYCWAYASIGAMSAALSIKSKKAVVPLSKHHLTDCLFKYYPDPKKEAELKEGETYGCSCSKAYRFAVEQGIAEEESYPYAMRRGDCKCTETMKKVKIAAYQRINIRRLSKGQIEEHIKRQPIKCSIRSYDSLKNHVGQSVYMGPTMEEIEDRRASLARGEKDSTHSMLIMGFGTDEDGQNYYLVQNSWEERWGYHGHDTGPSTKLMVPPLENVELSQPVLTTEVEALVQPLQHVASNFEPQLAISTFKSFYVSGMWRTLCECITQFSAESSESLRRLRCRKVVYLSEDN